LGWGREAGGGKTDSTVKEVAVLLEVAFYPELQEDRGIFCISSPPKVESGSSQVLRA
jgi:hypothetical protein